MAKMRERALLDAVHILPQPFKQCTWHHTETRFSLQKTLMSAHIFHTCPHIKHYTVSAILHLKYTCAVSACCTVSPINTKVHYL